MIVYRGFEIPEYKDKRWDLQLNPFMQKTIDFMLDIPAMFEFVSNNIKSYPHAITYTSGKPSEIIYTISASESITKTIQYNAGGYVSSILLTGSIPSSITKNITYDINNNISTVSYS